MHFTGLWTSSNFRRMACGARGEKRQRASRERHRRLAVSGGTTPEIFFNQLSAQSIEWEHVWITLVDERWVPAEREPLEPETGNPRTAAE